MSGPFDADVLIVGSGPAGVSAAWPLAEAGLRVLIVDGGRAPGRASPAQPYLQRRAQDPQQWRDGLGEDFRALLGGDAPSPKFRVPQHAPVFDGFLAANRIEAEGFVAVGSLATGGLSSAWGCGVARFTAAMRGDWPVDAGALDRAFEVVARRVGLSGASDDAMADWFGLDAWSEPALPMDAGPAALWARLGEPAARAAFERQGLHLGRARVAALAEDREADGRGRCTRTGNCLWGCARGALYSAADDLAALRRRHPLLVHRPGFVVERIGSADGQPFIEGRDAAGPARLRAPRLLLAAGTLASTRLALAALDHRQPVPLASTPVAAFLLLQPARLGAAPEAGFGLAQLAYRLALADGTPGFGSIFATGGLPLAEFVRRLAIGRRAAIGALAPLLRAAVVGNLALPGRLSTATATLTADGALRLVGGQSAAVPALMAEARGRLARGFRALGGWLVPGSFTIAPPGADLHYAATLPMRAQPGAAETDGEGRLAALPGVQVVDGAALPSLPEVSHTLAIMANAERIARQLAQDCTAGRVGTPRYR